MRCSIADCPGGYEQREVVRAVRQGDRIIVVEHIPAEVCDVCGDVLFTPETVERLEQQLAADGNDSQNAVLEWLPSPEGDSLLGAGEWM